MQVRSKVWFEKNGKLVFGEGKSKILKAIEKHRSINKAAGSLNMSFRHAWSYINEIERRIGARMIERTKGGRDGGGSRLTPLAAQLIERYDRLKEDVDEYADRRAKEFLIRWRDTKSSGYSLRKKRR